MNGIAAFRNWTWCSIKFLPSLHSQELYKIAKLTVGQEKRPKSRNDFSCIFKIWSNKIISKNLFFDRTGSSWKNFIIKRRWQNAVECILKTTSSHRGEAVLRSNCTNGLLVNKSTEYN